jgi:hypothetical protein
MNIPPSFSFSGNKLKAQSLRSRALQFYNSLVRRADVGSIGTMFDNLGLEDGSHISAITRKENNYSHRTGNVQIFGGGVGIEEIGNIELIIKLPEGIFKAILKGNEVVLDPFNKPTGFDFSWTNDKDLACSIENNSLFMHGVEYNISEISDSWLVLSVALSSKSSGYLLVIDFSLTLLKVYSFSVIDSNLVFTSILEVSCLEFSGGNIITNSNGVNELILIYDNILSIIKLKDLSTVNTNKSSPTVETTTTTTHTDNLNYTKDISISTINLDSYYIDPQITNTFNSFCIPIIKHNELGTASVSSSYSTPNLSYNSSSHSSILETFSRLRRDSIDDISLFSGHSISDTDHSASGSLPYSVSHITNIDTENHSIIFADSQVIVDNEYRFNITGDTSTYTTFGYPFTDSVGYGYTTSESSRKNVYIAGTKVYEQIDFNTLPYSFNITISVAIGSSTPSGTVITSNPYNDFSQYSPQLGKVYAYTDKLYAIIVDKTMLIFPIKNKTVQPTIIYQRTLDNYNDVKLSLYSK